MTGSKENNQGFIYIIYNDVFNFYGDNVFKIGKTIDIGKTINSCKDTYLNHTEIKFISELCSDYTLAENMIFDTLKTNRVNNKREFFRGDLKEIIEVIEDKVKHINDNYANLQDEMNKKDKLSINTLNDSLKLISLQYFYKIIHMLGFIDLQDNSLKNHDEFQQNINNVIDYLINSYDSDNKQFNIIMYRTKHNIKDIKGKSLKAMIGYINSFLKGYCIKISTVQKQEGSNVNKTNYYKIHLLKSEQDLSNSDQTDSNSD
jgi:hypothetical protein